MQVIPAVDVLAGRAVRLWKGDFGRVTHYGDDPVVVALEWMRQGAELVHVVDLDGARTGVPTPGLCARFAGSGVSFQLGGGIRTVASAEAMLAAGAERVVLGTAAVSDPATVAALIDRAGPEAVVAALDVARGRARGSGWHDGGVPLSAAVARVEAAGARRALVTGIARDGTLSGPDLALLDAVRAAAPPLRLIASGGVGSLEDLVAIADRGAKAAVVGKALYEGRFTFAEAMSASR